MKAHTILLIDDERTIRTTFRAALETEGFQVSEATSAEGAFASLRREPFDLAVLDLRLGEQSGMQILVEMRARGIQTPTLMITAHGRARDAVHAMRLGAIDFLQKPIDPAELRAAVADILARREKQPQRVEDGGVHHLLLEAKRLINLEEFETATNKVSAALQIDVESAEAQNLRGVLHEIGGDYAAARNCYWRALELDPHHSAAQGNLRRFFELHSRGRSEEPIHYEDASCLHHEGLA